MNRGCLFGLILCMLSAVSVIVMLYLGWRGIWPN